ncbi:TonB-dependent receptor [Danxiaibacter flavus]|uniref:TonB-dependent receptor n=1 Tax=Danxiaibacter flavus TaxID=3049108 RepID=A0ABV3ZG52_9BACT|nr:TonB-dependent receptor [Chitinophagaceae bacterium DXS]
MKTKHCRNRHLLVTIMLLFLVAQCPALLWAQTRTVQGNVVNEKGQPMPDVSVAVKGKSEGAITDVSGNFSIQLNAHNQVLVFSYVGYQSQEINLSDSSGDLHIAMSTRAEGGLNEIVVIGYGTKKKSSLTGSVATISGAEMSKSPVAALSNSLAGSLPGLVVNTRSGEPGADQGTINIRGIGTLGDNSPLIVIDGIPDRQGGLDRINPNDIATLTVLKDASAAIYGARAANGVILITTKRGAAGKTSLTFSTNESFTQPTRVPKLLNSYEYAIATNEYYNYIGQQPFFTDDDIQKFKDGSDPLGHPNTDWWNDVMRNWAFQTNNNISISGGSGKVNYFVSGQYLRQNSMYKGGADYYENKNGRANLDIQATNSFKINVDVLYRHEFKQGNSYGTGGIFHELWTAYPYLVSQYPDGKVGVGISGTPDNALLYTVNGALGYVNNSYDFLQTKTGFSWDLSSITKGLRLEGYYAYDLYNYNNKTFNATPPPAYAYDQSGDSLKQVNSTRTPNLTLNQQRQPNELYNIKIGYTKRFGLHALDVFAAYEQMKQTSTTLSAYRTGFIGNTVQELNAGSTIGATNNSGTDVFSRQNYIGRVSYGYDDKYLIDVNLRYDGSSIFAPGRRFGFFPGFSAAWRVSREAFFKSGVITDLKLRGSYGTLGNDRVAPYQYLQTYTLQAGQNGTYLANGYFYGSDYTQYAGFNLGPSPNPYITWERAANANIGVDMQLWHRLSVTVDVFRSMRSDILRPNTAVVPAYSGLVLPDVNFGKVLNRGIEVAMEYRKPVNKSFSYYVSGNFTYVANKIINIAEASSVPAYQKSTGYPSSAYLLYDAIGLYQNQDQIEKTPHPVGAKPGDIQYKDINGDGKIDGLDQIRITQSPVPQIVYGATMGATYKNFDVTVFFSGQAAAKAILMPNGLNMAEEFFTGRWQKEGDNKYPVNFNGPTNARFGSNAWSSTFWLRNNAFLRLKNVQIGYNIPTQLLAKAKIQALRIYVSGNNLFSIDKFGPSYDPESAPASSSGLGYPVQRVINVGLNLSF